jgi:hypothetical protein
MLGVGPIPAMQGEEGLGRRTCALEKLVLLPMPYAPLDFSAKKKDHRKSPRSEPLVSFFFLSSHKERSQALDLVGIFPIITHEQTELGKQKNQGPG